jgi:chromosome segregation protein
MRLKSLYIKGFKSFANETILNFSEDVIGVVGPNGSGKSNIVDAIRWVLGEQKSKELRLESMSDVIFNGTKTKKESATATVALTFENDKGVLPTEYQTVTISRTLYRSGESEYRLNNVPCRLKDINSLFIDTGIGSNSYAIIALGMVDDILADKEQSRRRMFEQAAGVSKYKIRKRETLSKLKSATEDLNRIDDLLFEIEGNLKTLEKQARRTQKFLDIRAEYKELSIRHAIHAIQHLKQKYKGISEQLLKDQDTYRSNDTKLTLLNASLEKDKKANLDKESALSDHQKKLNELVYQIRSRESEKGLLQQKAGFKKQTKEQLTRSIVESQKELEKTMTESNTLAARILEETTILENLKLVLAQSKQVYDDTREGYNAAKMSFDLRQKEKQELERQLFDIEKNSAILRNSLENDEREIARIHEIIASREKDFSQVKQELETISQAYAARETELSSLQQNETDRLQRIATLESERDKVQEELNKVHRTIDSQQNEYDLLKGMIDNFEGFPESIKFLNDHWKKELVILSDVIDVQEPYKAAVELFLEQYLNYFVVQNAVEAMQGITLLKNSQKGKAHFFLLEKVPSIGKQGQHEGLIPATEVVNTPKELKKLTDFLLFNVFIYNGEGQLPDGIESEKMTVISSAGTLLQQGCTLTGGSVGLFEGKKMGRKKQLEKLAESLEKNQKARTELSQSLSKIKNDISTLKSATFQSTIEKVKKELQLADQERIRMQHKLDTFNQVKAESEAKEKLLRSEIRDIETKLSLSEQQQKQLRKKLEQLEQSGDGKVTDMDQISEKMSAASEKFNQDNIAQIRQQNLVANFVKDKEFRDLKISELTLKTDNDKQKLLSEDRERIDIEDQLTKLEKELQELYTEKKQFQSTLSEAEQEFLKARNLISALEDEIRTLTRTQVQLQQTIQSLKDQFTEQKFQIQAVGERLRIEFQISVNDIINQEADSSLDYESLTEELERVKGKLQSYGDVNPLALEAYNEMKERFDNMQTQRKDILEAKDSLMDTIKEIEETATGQFMDSFRRVRENFIEVFRSLFTEDDTCDLILLDESNPLESEIEIVAKPKGKKPKSLSQLSGGEKTLTATALLFALYLLKPAPFCIFDEVDAPLDDANIQKFNNIIRKFSQASQFIIVTHNKSTMAEVNVLYGVYMVEPGVSAVSPVDFRSLKHDPIMASLQ